MQAVNLTRNEAYKPLYQTPPRIIRLHGGAGSGKSIAWAQWCIIQALQNPLHRIFVFRKVARTVRDSVFSTFVDLLRDMGMLWAWNVNKSTYTITSPDGVKIICGGMDDPEKVKSIKDPTIIVMEEATEFTKKDFQQLNLRLRKEGVPNHLVLAYNPISKANWIYKDFDQDNIHAGQEMCIRTTYKDNLTFLPNEYVAELERLAATDENYHKVYARGEWGDIVEGLIYPNYVKIDDFPADLVNTDIYGIDFGFVDPYAWVRVGVREKDVYIDEIFYGSGYVNSKVAEAVRERGVKGSDLAYADSAKPGDIQDLYSMGFRGIRQAKKGQGSLSSGIKKVLGYNLHVTKRSSNVQSELDQYCWAKDRDGEPIEGKPIDDHNHALDAVRYALYTHFYAPQQQMTAW